MSNRNVDAYAIRALDFDPQLVAKVAERRGQGESVAQIAKALKVGAGKAAMAELIAATERVSHDDPIKLARAIAKDRATGASWGRLSARYGVTEGTCRAAFTAATGKPWQSLDFRKKERA